ncbi:uncharacterized protein K452DRAFT_87650 [Aplosporella prunicola CBS 121167]|uniref:HECT-type E3 ubiquitin transferase n=1 Tax=Aplosporella prunicola CBS 121167 TaxID=1176127 RepID=A0A6A6B6U8_9PEZI|nr:uncharacterized protein K452DRAFT_87650 [Aplosporella prunicola CBS 121167]KAF2138521.1 hypothetical protein K452DRAFT_87650 [Aplosporella prunicola CBS 121167]
MPSWNKQHSRSASHPFPALFGSKKRSGGNLNGDYSPPDDDKYLPYTTYGDAGTMRRDSGKRDDRDLETSACMTCDSKVKYPRGLKTFRCPGCLTVTDLVPIPGERGDGNLKSYPGIGPKRPMPLSVERTRNIIDRCLTLYLQARCEQCASPTKETGEPRTSPMPIRERAYSASRPAISLSPSETDGFGLGRGPRSPTKPGPSLQPSVEHPVAPDSQYMPPPGPRVSPHQPPPNRRPPPPPISGHGPSPIRNPQTSPRKVPSPMHPPPPGAPLMTPGEAAARRRYEHIKTIFKPLEDYIITSFGNHACLNTAFSTSRQRPSVRTRSEGSADRTGPAHARPQNPIPQADFLPEEADPRMLMLGDIGENGSWWTGHAAKEGKEPSGHQLPVRGKSAREVRQLVNHKSALINWAELECWYGVVINAGMNWKKKLESIPGGTDLPKAVIGDADEEIRDARIHAQRTLLKVTENILKRPGRPLKDPEDIRFLLILLFNPLLHTAVTSTKAPKSPLQRPRQGSIPPPRPSLDVPSAPSGPSPERSPNSAHQEPGQHSGIIKRIIGMLANLSNECHRYLTTWCSRLSEDHFRQLVDLVGKFVTYRLTRQRGRKRSNSGNPTAGLIPEFSSNGATSAQLHAALGLSGAAKKPKEDPKVEGYSDDWQIKAAAKVMAILFAANNTYHARKSEPVNHAPSIAGQPSAGLAAQERARAHGQLLPTSDFYNTLLDYHDLIADFEAWEKRTAKFSFCQYPFFLSIGAKIRIMEHDAKRQMENKAREAFFDSILSNKNLEQYLNLKVRRECLVDDSLRRISEVVGGGSEDIKKGLRVQFVGEEGIDAGGLRKEWFLLLVRELFDPMHGMFVYDEDSHFCYFNPHTLEMSDQFFLVGAVLGLAIYNSTILDVALPPFAFKKLLASAPARSSVASSSRNTMHYTLEDLAEFRPALAHGLRQLLEFDGDVEATFCRDFVAEVERYGTVSEVPLCTGGERRAVTNKNRQEFVDLYIRFMLDQQVARQFDPFRRGFFTVCGGNALSLFRSEEIELLVRGSDEPLDVASVRAVAVYEGWKERERKVERPGETVLVLRWFWDIFEAANPRDQRKILSFITGSDRIPAVGATNLVIKLTCLGEDSDRFPVARTCFNMLQLYKYRSRAKLEEKLWRAVLESEGFGLK